MLMPGIQEATGLTGKDEFFLGLRTPMEMIEGDHWLVPFLDGAPRIRKPPLLYWLGRASYEIFGVSLASARLIVANFHAPNLPAAKTKNFWQAPIARPEKPQQRLYRGDV